jgi:p-cumate 2,3-dioxygenase beta subunit
VISQNGAEAEVTANFIVYRMRGDANAFVGRYRYRLVRDGSSFRIRYRRAELDNESLDPHGTVSIVL